MTQQKEFRFWPIVRVGVLLALSVSLFARPIPGRYIVELSTEPVAAHMAAISLRAGIRGTAASAHRTRIRTEQRVLRNRLTERGVEVLDSADTVANALFVRMPDDDISRLTSAPGVLRVRPVRAVHMLLDRAVILHKVPEAWNRVGNDHAGAGVKIAIIDSGIEAGHPGFQDSSLTPPDSFPRVAQAVDQAQVNNKVIVARSYVGMLSNRDPDHSASDRVGHGTALAMTAAGVRVAGPLATITGVAPKAFLGNYKIFGTPGYNDDTSDDVVIKAMDDAVADGMDVINLSLGVDLAPRLNDDPVVQAVEQASQAGVIVVASAGNNGPDLNTLASPATAPSVIAVGASTNDRTFAASVELPGLATYIALPSDSPTVPAPVSAEVADIAVLDNDGRACAALPANSLSNRIALILRGTCTFETKLINAQRAGAVAGLIYAAADSPDAIHMAVGSATLPAEMISNGDGQALKQALASTSSLVITMRFTAGAVPATANFPADFSAAGPSVDLGIKPDLMAVGADVYTATQTLDSRGDMYSSSGFVLVDGTSFSSPLVAGAAALVKSARPGLTVNQYRSLLINTAADLQVLTGREVTVQQSGAGLLDVDAAVRSTVAAYPASLSLGTGHDSGGAEVLNRTLTLSNVSDTSESYQLSAVSGTAMSAPALSAESLELGPGESAEVSVSWNIAGLPSGAHAGFLLVTGSLSGVQIRIPYWYATPSGAPAHVTILSSVGAGRRGSLQRDAILFRVTDAAGIALTDVQPDVTVTSGQGSVRRVVSYDSEVPGIFGLDVVLGPSAGANVFRIQAGEAEIEVTLAGQ